MSGIRWYRTADMDLLAGDETAQPRSERLREMVDELPDKERFVIERCFFGGATMREAAKELGVSEKRAREIRGVAFERLRAVLEADEVGPLQSATVGEVG